jgi:hypothetical protein
MRGGPEKQRGIMAQSVRRGDAILEPKRIGPRIALKRM